ncbi:MAG: DNA (cytosine-5-)-methyltransferase [Oceanospirillaceae bacterium]|nr:DNA (cytosine-5-)-methyltransferase [Oceanospirillaceae bacterium]
MKSSGKIVDLFSGCGGFGLGAELAGFETYLAVDVDSVLNSSYQLNFPNAITVTMDLSKTTESEWAKLLQNESIDGVIGGPPCQAYSRMGRREANDPRRNLVYHFYRNVKIIKPKFFVMENVEGILDNGNFTEVEESIKLISSEYEVVGPVVINALDCGAPTSRKRVVIVGYKKTYFDAISEADFEFRKKHVTVLEAISDLPGPIQQSKDKTNYGWAHYPIVKDGISPYAKRMRKCRRGLGSKISKTALKAFEVSGNFETLHSPAVVERYKALKPDQVDSVSRAKRLSWDGYCPTLRAGTGSDKGSHQAVRPIHPTEPRVITVREAARLQGFPDWFIFHTAKWHSFRMIGNSVSPQVSENIFRLIKSKFLQGNVHE